MVHRSMTLSLTTFELHALLEAQRNWPGLATAPAPAHAQKSWQCLLLAHATTKTNQAQQNLKLSKQRYMTHSSSAA